MYPGVSARLRGRAVGSQQAHVAERWSLELGIPRCSREPPVGQVNFAEVSEEHVLRFDVVVQDAACMRVRKSTGHLEEGSQQAHQRPLAFEFGARKNVSKRLLLDDSHRVIGLAIG